MTPTAHTPRSAFAGSALRWALACAGGATLAVAIVYRAELWKAATAALPALGALLWSLAHQVWANRQKWAAYLATPPAHHSPPAAAGSSLEPTMIDLTSLLASARSALIVSGIANDALKVLDDGIAATQSLVEQELAAAEAKFPPALAPFKDEITALVDDGAATLAAKAEKLAAAKLALMTA